MREIRRVLTDRSRSFQDALKMSGSEEFWKEILTQEQKQDGENILLEDDDGKGVVCIFFLSVSLPRSPQLFNLFKHSIGERGLV